MPYPLRQTVSAHDEVQPGTAGPALVRAVAMKLGAAVAATEVQFAHNGGCNKSEHDPDSTHQRVEEQAEKTGRKQQREHHGSSSAGLYLWCFIIRIGQADFVTARGTD